MNDDKEYKPLTHEELVAEAIALIQRAEKWQIKKALEAAMNCQKKSAQG